MANEETSYSFKPDGQYNKDARDNLDNMKKRIQKYQERLNNTNKDYGSRVDKIHEIIITGYLRDLNEMSKVFADQGNQEWNYFWDNFRKIAKDEINIIKNEFPRYFKKYNKLNNMEKLIKLISHISPKSTRRSKRLSEKLNKGGDIHKHFQKIRKHQGIHQSGGKKGKLKKGYKYSGKKTKTGLSIIVKVSK